jgi:hypothetical protein
MSYARLLQQKYCRPFMLSRTYFQRTYRGVFPLIVQDSTLPRGCQVVSFSVRRYTTNSQPAVEDIERLFAKYMNDLLLKISVDNKLEVLGSLKTELKPLRADVKDMLKAIRSVSERIDVISTKLDSYKIEVNAKFDNMKAEIIPKIDNVTSELGGRLEGIRAEYAEKMDEWIAIEDCTHSEKYFKPE